MTCYNAVRIVSQRLSAINENIYQTQITNYPLVPPPKSVLESALNYAKIVKDRCPVEASNSNLSRLMNTGYYFLNNASFEVPTPTIAPPIKPIGSGL
ncbi:hypothetical protein [Okeania sp. SIO1I7]|uniref:hypothetical protein n=1 Tax=Okeania sp. SIO1I7 TaxID=2607772 RepID=UPI0013F6E105|nr:hypothetical protein [Okeania sp. SIO1I7]NET27685.1 hypothetical protein [Okeania sp. SIO1I7]